MMARLSAGPYGETPFQKRLGHNRYILRAWNELSEILEQDGALFSTLKEQVRRALAQKNGCEYCKAKGRPDPQLVDEKTGVAIGFAEAFLQMRGAVPDSIFEVAREALSEREMSELCAFICFTTASQFFGALMDLQPDEQ